MMTTVKGSLDVLLVALSSEEVRMLVAVDFWVLAAHCS
jgi:hypothetical protein